MTVGLLESVIVPDEIESALEMANDGADDNVTVLAPAVVERPTIQLPVCVALTEVAEDGMTVGLLDSVTVGTEDKVTVPEEMEMALEIANAGADESVTVLAPATVDRVVVMALDGVIEATEDRATVLLVSVT